MCPVDVSELWVNSTISGETFDVVMEPFISYNSKCEPLKMSTFQWGLVVESGNKSGDDLKSSSSSDAAGVSRRRKTRPKLHARRSMTVRYSAKWWFQSIDK